jgi:hypothetical protein
MATTPTEADEEKALRRAMHSAERMEYQDRAAYSSFEHMERQLRLIRRERARENGRAPYSSSIAYVGRG